MASAVIWTDLHELYDKAAPRFRLPPHTIFKPLLTRWRCKKDGEAYKAERGSKPTVWIRVHRYHRPKEPLKRSTIMATFAHEIAHLAPGCWDHGPAHRAKTEEIAAWLREQGQPVGTVLHRGTYIRRRKKG